MEKTRWYKDAVMYQIYPRSFADSNGDGVGDLRGIINKIPYLQSLGINGIWLSPVYKSPNDDNGYDISDYRNIQPEFGTLDDFKELVAKLHGAGIRLIMDLVVNHSSDENYWFEESRKSIDNPYRDYYIWRKGRGKGGKKPPNNWTSRFTGSAWQRDEITGEYYLHLFSKKQPDLNWDNPKVREEVKDICRYWFDMGVDGFRCDVITYIGKEDGLPMGKFNPVMCGDEHFILHDKCHRYLKELNREVWSKYDTLIVGEAAGVYADTAHTCAAEGVGELDSIITFEHLETEMLWQFFPVKLNLPKFKRSLSRWQALPDDCWQTLYYENHDQPRSASRFTRWYKGDYRVLAAKMLAVSLHFQRGTPYIYQGQELGMTNIDLKENEYLDIMARQIFTMIRKFCPPLMPLARYAMKHRARDHARTPMQWDSSANGGFTTGTAWMKVNPNYAQINAAAEEKDGDSVLNFYKKLIKLRIGDRIIRNGTYTELHNKDKNLFIYERAYEGERYLVICNFKPKTVKNKVAVPANALLVLSTYRDTMSGDIRPFEARVYKICKTEV